MTDQERTQVEHDALVNFRLDQLDKQAVGFRETERRADLLAAAVARFEAGLAESNATATIHHQQIREENAKLSSMLEQLIVDDAREKGAAQERARLGKWMIAGTASGAAVAGVVVSLLTLVFQH